MHLKILDKFEEGSTITKIKMGYVDFECTWSGNQIRIVSPSHTEVTMAIFRHVLNLIKFSKNIQLDLLLNSNEVNSFPVLEGVISTALKGRHHDTSTVETFCNKYPSQKSMLLIPKLSGGLNQNSPILKLEEICFHNSKELISTFLDSFSGRIGFFYRAQCPETSIIKFMRNWMAGSAHQNLEVLSVAFDTGFFIFAGIILKEFENERTIWNPEKRPENYEFDSKITGMDSTEKNINCSHFFDIERHSDGKLASFSVTPFRFQFCVWNLTA
ncbi:unnamed protein product [Caenorhabditis brenneri]